MSDKEKKNLFTDNTHENKLYIKDLLIQKYECNIYSLNPFINFKLDGHQYEPTQ